MGHPRMGAHGAGAQWWKSVSLQQWPSRAFAHADIGLFHCSSVSLLPVTLQGKPVVNIMGMHQRDENGTLMYTDWYLSDLDVSKNSTLSPCALYSAHSLTTYSLAICCFPLWILYIPYLAAS